MGEYEPHDSRKVTLRQERAPGEPPRTGPREGETRQPQQSEIEQGELYEDGRGDDVEEMAGQPDEAVRREQAMEQDEDAFDAP